MIKIPVTGVLIRETVNNVNRYIDGNVKQYGIRNGQVEYLINIGFCQGITMADLATIHCVGKASVTKAVKVLIDKEYVMKKRSDEDARISHLYLTDKGVDLLDHLTDRQNLIEKTLYADIDDDDFAIFNRTLMKIMQNSSKLIK